jgi:hypothetical protein
MPLNMRGLSVAALFVIEMIGLGFADSTASASGTAAEVIDTASTNATSNNSVWSILALGGGIGIRCSSVVMRWSIASTGAVTVPLGGTIWSGCTLAGVAVAFTQTNPWIGRIRHLDNAAGDVSAVTLDIDFGGLLALHFNGIGCEIDWGLLPGATELGSYTPPTPVAHGVRTPMPSMVLMASLAASRLPLISSEVRGTGCGLIGIAVGQPATFSALFTFNPVIVGTGI